MTNNNIEKKAKYTYIDFANDVLTLINKDADTSTLDFDKIAEKANALIEQQLKKREYNASHPKKSTSKGAGEKTKVVIDKIKPILRKGENNAMTGAEINAAVNENFYALQIANAVKFIEGVQSTKVIRTTTNSKGLKQEKEYTAYYIG